MRRFLIGLLLVVTCSLTSIMITAAQETPAPDTKFGTLRTLANYLPQNSIFYAAVRTDPGYIETLDGLINRLAEALPEGTLPVGFDPRLSALLDMGVSRAFEVDFKSGVRPWLGEALAFGIGPLDALADDSFANNENVDYGFFIDITDREAATAFLESALPNLYFDTAFQRQDEADYTRFTPVENYIPVDFFVSDSLMVIGSNPNVLPMAGAPEMNLNNNAYFDHALLALPADSYHAVYYVDFPSLLSYAFSSPYSLRDERPLAAAALRTVGPLAGGGTMVREGEGAQTLILDTLLSEGNLTGIEAFGFELGDPVRLDPEFLPVIPSNAALAIHGTNPLGVVELLTRNYPVVEPYIYNAALSGIDYYGYSLTTVATITALTREFPKFPAIISGNLFGLDYEKEVKNLLGSDYVLFARANPGVVPEFYTNGLTTLDWAVVSQVGDPAQARESMRTIQRDLPNTLRTLGARGVTFTQEQIGSAEVLVLSIDPTSYVDDETPYELAIAVKEGLFAFGTRRAVTDTITTDVMLRATAPAFTILQGHLLPDASMNWYASGPQLTLFLDVLNAARGYIDPETEIIRSLLLWGGEGVLSLTVNETGDTVLRAALSITPSEVLGTVKEQYKAAPLPERPSTDGSIAQPPTAVPLPTLVQMLPTITPAPSNIIQPETTAEAVAPLQFMGAPTGRTADGAFTLGNARTPLTVVVFMDYFCPPCQAFFEDTLRPFIAEDVVHGQAKIEFHTLVTAGQDRTRAVTALADCTDQQQPGAFWHLADYAFSTASRGTYVEENGLAFARGFNIDERRLQACINSSNRVAQDAALAQQLNVGSTPTVFVRYWESDELHPVEDRSLEGLRRLVTEANPLSAPFVPTQVPLPSARSSAQDGQRFLEQNLTAEGVITTESGLQYKVVVRGNSDERPGPTDTVTVNYRGTLVDGTEFDASDGISFPLNAVIAGWTEGLQLMSPGDIFMLYLPPELAYGSREMGELIPANSVLIFEVELLAIE